MDISSPGHHGSPLACPVDHGTTVLASSPRQEPDAQRGPAWEHGRPVMEENRRKIARSADWRAQIEEYTERRRRKSGKDAKGASVRGMFGPGRPNPIARTREAGADVEAEEFAARVRERKAAELRCRRMLRKTRELVDAHPELQEAIRKEQLDALHRRIDAEDFVRSTRGHLLQMKRQNQAFMRQLRMAEQQMWS
mmetsp:Transcript_15075/g.48080  ORF Transcript_15075/g.48080 Transcript_15075/m.48080 type:complete len:195 (+) Transcript_15075:2-586(+)